MTKVSIVKTNPQAEYKEILNAVSRALELIGGIRDVVKGLGIMDPDRIEIVGEDTGDRKGEKVQGEPEAVAAWSMVLHRRAGLSMGW